MNIIIPMAGKGERFSKAGFTLPKPLIPIAGKPMYRYAADCLPLHLASRVIFVLRQNDFSDMLENDIQSHYGPSYPTQILLLSEETRGQAETVLKAESLLDLNQPTLVHNCDTAISAMIDWQDIVTQDIDGALALFSSQEDRWSYAALDITGTRIIDVQEKKVISSHASTGTYFFKNTPDLLDTIRTLIDQNLRENNEFYLSTVYRLMLDQQKILIPLSADPLLCFGTPSDLVHSLNSMIGIQNNIYEN